MQVTGKTCDKVRKDMEDAINKVAKKHGLDYGEIVGVMRYSPESLRFRVEMKTNAADKKKVMQDATIYNLWAGMIGLPPFGSIVRPKRSNDTFKITGYAKRRKKYPISLECMETGKKSKATTDFVRSATFIKPGTRTKW